MLIQEQNGDIHEGRDNIYVNTENNSKVLTPFKTTAHCNNDGSSSQHDDSGNCEVGFTNHTLDQGESLSCTLCNKTFATKVNLTGHIDAVHNKLEPFPCTLCGESFSFKQVLIKHIKLVHDDSGKTKSLFQFDCSLCSKKFTSKRCVKRHIDAVHKNLRPFSCKVCKVSFKENCKLKIHKKSKTHKMAEIEAMQNPCPVDDNGKIISDNNCGTKIETPSPKNNHGEIGVDILSQQDCNNGEILTELQTQQENNDQGDLARHVRSQTKQKPFSCSLCSQHFSRKYHLNRHFDSVHRKLRPHSCKFCGKSYSQKSDCDTHACLVDVQVSHVHEKENVEKSLILLSSQNSPQWQGSSTITAESRSRAADNGGILSHDSNSEVFPEPQTQQEHNGQGQILNCLKFIFKKANSSVIRNSLVPSLAWPGLVILSTPSPITISLTKFN